MLAMRDAGTSWGLLGAVADIAATGIELPQGDPDDLRRAATTWVHAGQQLATQRRILDRAALTAAMANWTGTAAMSYMSAAQTVGHELQRGAGSCRMAGLACRQLATALDHAQDVARAAIARAQDALDRIDAAKRQVGEAAAAAAAADHEAGEAQAMADTARGVAGPLGEAGALQARQREQAARSDGRAARAARGRAQAMLEEAEDDLRRARHRGAEANRDARDAGRKAAMALADVASDARVSKHSFQPAVPGSPAGTPVGPLDPALKLLATPLTGGSATIAGVNVDLGASPSNVAGDALGGGLALADRRARAARTAARTAFGRLASTPHGATDAMRADALRRYLKAAEDVRQSPARGWKGSGLRGASKVLRRFNPAFQFYENQKEGMPLAENTLRTGLSTAAGDTAAGAGVVCVWGAPACAAVFGYAGQVAGDAAGGVLYDGFDAAYQDGVKPLAHKAADAAGDIAHAVTGALPTFRIGR